MNQKINNLKITKNVFIALGSNLGNRVDNIQSALTVFRKNSQISVVDTSFLYETDPMYYLDQPTFLNAVVKIETTLSPHDLLKLCKKIEIDKGRNLNDFKNRPRPLDLDIIFYNDLIISTSDLIIPHPLLSEREFVLKPLCDIDPDFKHPKLSKSVNNLLSLLKHSSSDLKNNQLEQKMRKVFSLCNREKKLHFVGSRTLIMGILNITPDSFSDGGDFFSVEKALQQAKNLVKNGADIIDIGGNSTRPGAEIVSGDIEKKRIIPAIEAIRNSKDKNLCAIPISVDTFNPEVAQAALKSGADMINDVTAGEGLLRYKEKLLISDYWKKLKEPMFELAREENVPIILMHSRGTSNTMTSLTSYDSFPSVIHGVVSELTRRVNYALSTGIPRWNILLDPGFGFAKTAQQNYQILQDFHLLTASFFSKNSTFSSLSLAGYPWLGGTSRKSFIGQTTGQVEPKKRIFGTAATITTLIAKGVEVIRVHDVEQMKDVVKVSDQIWKNKSNQHSKEK